MELAKLHRERAVDAVYNSLRQAIVGYTLKPGTRLNVDELAKQLGVSLTPVRGAIQQLATEGLVEVHPRSGTFVASLTPQDVEETFKIRCALECLAAEEAMEALSPRDIKALRELLKAMKKPVRTDADRDTHERANAQLHQTIIGASGNRRLQEMYNALNAHIKIASIHSTEGDWASRLHEEQAEHDAIVEALAAQDVPAVNEALRKHIYRAKDALVRSLKARLGESDTSRS